MNRLFGGIRIRVSRIRRKFSLETLGLTVPPFTASFKVKHNRNKTTMITKIVHRVPAAVSSSPFDIFWDTVDTMTDAERKSAIKRRNWETAIIASLVQGYVRQGRMKQPGGV